MPPTASRKFPVLSATRLTLRAATPKDVPAFRALLSVPDVTRFSNWPDAPHSYTALQKGSAVEIESGVFLMD